jgi:hypothetical protein
VALAAVVAGCGSTSPVTTDGTSPQPVASQGAAQAASVYSASYCQPLGGGRWVTNDSPHSTTPCVPDLTYAESDHDGDDAAAVPRCFTCTMSQFKQAERRHLPAPGRSVTSTSPDSTYLARSQLATRCAAQGAASAHQCACIAAHLATVTSMDEIQSLPADDPRLQAALDSCMPSGN